MVERHIGTVLLPIASEELRAAIPLRDASQLRGNRLGVKAEISRASGAEAMVSAVAAEAPRRAELALEIGPEAVIVRHLEVVRTA